ncbi:MFS transporter [Plantactinospora sp. KLBMP9567]|uniref:MFS transporter n=1 Tax=Plantactinospora sp. KLBMP9567 TaxID=3085900 RepID=UPI002981CEC1|nr:MFS transporter [Plantactinospora sp. KLBMP9567]MDW5325968.1 MFS transporter [Plantactinospora sp. KLBMP9567]
MRAGRWRSPKRRNTLLFVGISLTSGFGGTALNVAAGVWVLDLSGSSSLAALTGLCLFAPTLLGPVLGALVDRLPRRRLIVWTHLLTALAVLSLLAVRTDAQVWLVYLVLLGYGTSLVLVDAAENALLPAALPPAALGGVNGLRTSAQEGVKLVAPLVGAGLFAWQGGYPVAALTAGALALAAGLYTLLRIRPRLPSPPDRSTGSRSGPADPDRPPAPPEPAERGTRRPGRKRRVPTGVAFLWRDPELRTSVLVGSVTIAMSGLTTAAVYAVVTEDLHQPGAFVGVLSSGQGAGSLLGGLVVGRLLRTRGSLAVGVLGAALFALGTLGRAVPWSPAAVACSVVVGIGLPWTLVAAVTAVQSRTPEALLGRVSGSVNTLLFAPVAIATPVGAALVLPDHRLPLVVAAVLCLGVGPVALRSARHARRAGTRESPTPQRPTPESPTPKSPTPQSPTLASPAPDQPPHGADPGGRSRPDIGFGTVPDGDPALRS